MQRIALKTAQARVQDGCREASIIEGKRGYMIALAGDVLRSQREDELAFLTIDGAVNYVKRHLSPPSGPALVLTIAHVPPGAR
jgi:hypothetical protein